MKDKKWIGGLEHRTSWDDTFLALAFVIAQRSIDPHTACGAVLVSKDKRILSAGYNGPIKNSNDKEFPIERVEKYPFVLHAEQNALLQYYGNFQDIQDSTMYITGRPCHSCLKEMLQKGIRRIVYSNALAKMVDKKDMEIQEKMLRDINCEVEIIEYSNPSEIKEVLIKTLSYMQYKEEVKNI